MRIPTILVPVAALTCGAASVMAQDAPPAEATTPTPANGTLTAEQQAEHDLWTPDQQAQYAAWPADVQGYYWALSADRQSLFWRLSDENKVTITNLPAEQQEMAWSQVEAQAAGAPAPATQPSAQPTADVEVVDESAADEPM